MVTQVISTWNSLEVTNNTEATVGMTGDVGAIRDP